MTTKTVFYSIGQSCMPALCLRHLKLRHTAGPFDWTFTSYPFLLRLLDDTSRNGNDLSSMIDPELIQSVSAPEPKALHLWANFLPIFEHKDPANSAEDRDHYKRAIANFLQDLRDPAIPVCLLWMFDSFRNELSNNVDMTFECALHLQKQFIACGGTNFNMLVIVGDHRPNACAYEERRHGIELHARPKMSTCADPGKRFRDVAQIIEPFLRRFIVRDAAQDPAQDAATRHAN